MTVGFVPGPGSAVPQPVIAPLGRAVSCRTLRIPGMANRSSRDIGDKLGFLQPPVFSSTKSQTSGVNSENAPTGFMILRIVACHGPATSEHHNRRIPGGFG